MEKEKDLLNKKLFLYGLCFFSVLCAITGNVVVLGIRVSLFSGPSIKTKIYSMLSDGLCL